MFTSPEQAIKNIEVWEDDVSAELSSKNLAAEIFRATSDIDKFWPADKKVLPYMSHRVADLLEFIIYSPKKEIAKTTVANARLTRILAAATFKPSEYPYTRHLFAGIESILNNFGPEVRKIFDSKLNGVRAQALVYGALKYTGIPGVKWQFPTLPKEITYVDFALGADFVAVASEQLQRGPPYTIWLFDIKSSSDPAGVGVISEFILGPTATQKTNYSIKGESEGRIPNEATLNRAVLMLARVLKRLGISVATETEEIAQILDSSKAVRKGMLIRVSKSQKTSVFREEFLRNTLLLTAPLVIPHAKPEDKDSATGVITSNPLINKMLLNLGNTVNMPVKLKNPR